MLEAGNFPLFWKVTVTGGVLVLPCETSLPRNTEVEEAPTPEKWKGWMLATLVTMPVRLRLWIHWPSVKVTLPASWAGYWFAARAGSAPTAGVVVVNAPVMFAKKVQEAPA